MNPLSQSHSIPLAEGICRTISDMNADHAMVTQETLMEQLVKNYPGIPVPSHKILYNILGTLIKERKIYHTGEGYFIVTPNTYFITNDATEDNRRVPLEDSCSCSSPSLTYLVNIERYADLVKENIPAVSRYRSCHCFPDQSMLCEQRQQQPMNHEPNGGGKKGCSELKLSIQTQGISTSAENHSWDTIKSVTSVKEKLKSKRFGFGLFWRSTSKKEKHKKQYSTFSAQFPPKEWPVRDEDDLDNIPRDIEHEIVKRINPALTVDNLIKHTIFMQKFEEQKKYISKGTLAEVSVVRQNHLSKDCIQKTQSKTAKHTRKTKSKKEKQISRSNRKSHIHELTSQNEKLEENLSLPTRNQQSSNVAMESCVIYKRQIKNPFQGMSWRRNFYVKGYKGTINSQLKSRIRKQERALQRPQSLDSSKPFDYETEQLATETQAVKAKQNKLLHANRSSLQLKKDSLSENFSYLQGSTLQIDNKSKYFLESNISEENIERRRVKKNPGDVKKSPCSYTEDNNVCKEDAKFVLHLKDEYCRCKADTACELLDQTANEFQNVSLSNYTANINPVKTIGVKHRQKTVKKSELVFKYDCASHSGSIKLESEGFTGNCHLLYQKAHDGDTCNSLHLDDNFESNEPCHLPPGHAFSETRACSKAVQKLGTAMSLKNCNMANAYPAQYNATVNKHDSGEHGCKESASFAESIDGSKEYPRDFTEESCLCSQVLAIGHREEEETSLAECTKASTVADFCHANEADSDADALQVFSYDIEVAACCALHSQAKELSNPLGKKRLFLKDACTMISGQNSEGTENHSITGDSGIDSPRWTERKMKLPAKF
ncbi:storkhead-box protein 1 [Falco peregrinus]|uniref:storkhead-box protein 1 n=1 Tax=Falco peregrinus TaxID=8954 RepID=UPI00038719C2|nr:storkhead-box protein 1 [Falco peregrinus]XP_055663905.1 storkhead-box protein 1 [Falco peregrinus]XP_055663910.1 storkhead-box protein 1 [Falco peregrinus]